jgi:hypothetical protein
LSLAVEVDGTTTTNTWLLANGDAGYRSYAPVVQKSTAMQIQLQDASGSGGGTAGFTPVAISIEVESDGKLRQLAAEERA